MGSNFLDEGERQQQAKSREVPFNNGMHACGGIHSTPKFRPPDPVGSLKPPRFHHLCSHWAGHPSDHCGFPCASAWQRTLDE